MIWDAEKTIKALQGMIAATDPAITKAIVAIGNAGQSNASQTKWYKDRTGDLRRNTKFHLDGLASGALVANTAYAGYVQFGNRPGGLGKYIYPKNGTHLRFVIDGKVIYAKRVRSHGPLNFMTDAASEMLRKANIVMQVNLLDSWVGFYE